MRGVKFESNPQSYNPHATFVAHLSGVDNKEELLEQLSKKLNFPEYFGFNWDALLDILCDFSWIEQYSITLVHDELPALDVANFKIYIEVLFEAVKSWQNWKGGEIHNFEIVFPDKARELVTPYFLE